MLHLQEAAPQSLTSPCVCSREDAFENGILVDVSDVARTAGFRAPIALSEAAWRDCVSWEDDEDNRRKGVDDSEDARLWDVLQAASEAIKAAHHRRFSGTEILCSVYRIPRPGLFRSPRKVDLRLTLDFEGCSMVGTIALASEDK